jgi:hypothetical protein
VEESDVREACWLPSPFLLVSLQSMSWPWTPSSLSLLVTLTSTSTSLMSSAVCTGTGNNCTSGTAGGRIEIGARECFLKNFSGGHKGTTAGPMVRLHPFLLHIVCLRTMQAYRDVCMGGLGAPHSGRLMRL